jgi:8-oxo-dGTP pyrophosphatase MutT (NUDIX family)
MLLGRFSSADLVQGGRVIERTAVRGVLFRGRELLLLASRHGDYKFPGGGTEADETPQEALVRELTEECGVTGVRIGEVLVRATERRAAREEGAVFTLVNVYFHTEMPDVSAEDQKDTGLAPPPEMDGYEIALQLAPEWIDVETALMTNRRLLTSWTDEEVAARAPWLERETGVLGEVRAWLADKHGAPSSRKQALGGGS